MIGKSYQYFMLIFFLAFASNGSASIGVKGLSTQNLSFGGFYNLHRVWSVNFSPYLAPYFNSWAFNHSYGLMVSYELNKNSDLNFRVGKTRLVNSFNIYRENPTFNYKERKSNKSIPNIYWNTTVYSLSYSRKVWPSLPIIFEFGLNYYNGQSTYGNLPQEVLTDRQYEHDITDDNQKATIKYSYFRISESPASWALQFGLKHKLPLSKRIRSEFGLYYDAGLSPMAASRVQYKIVREGAVGSINGSYNSLTQNNGIHLSVSILFLLNKDRE